MSGRSIQSCMFARLIAPDETYELNPSWRSISDFASAGTIVGLVALNTLQTMVRIKAVATGG